MAENQNRKLRARRPPPYLIGDNSDPELFGYARTNFTKDFVSPAQELNSIAKILAKFVNSTNKRTHLETLDLLEKINDTQSKETSGVKVKTQNTDDQAKKVPNTADGGKRRPTQKYETKDNIGKGKEIGGSRDQQQEQSGVKDKMKTGEVTKKQGQTIKNTRQANKTDYPSNINYMNKLQELKQQQGMDLANLSKLQLDAATRAMQQQQQILNYNPSLRETLRAQNNFQGKTQQSTEKFFRRSTYHIAIAYHIHLNNIKDSGKDVRAPMILDPTYHAKKLKGQYDQHPTPNNAFRTS